MWSYVWQHKTSRIIENCPTSRLHSSKTKGVVNPTNDRLTIFKPSALIWCRLHVHSTLRLGATGTQTYTIWKHMQTCCVWLTLASSQVFSPNKTFRIQCLPTQHLILSHAFPLCASLGATEQPKSTISKCIAILQIPGWPHTSTLCFCIINSRWPPLSELL